MRRSVSSPGCARCSRCRRRSSSRSGTQSVVLLDAAWAIPVAIAFSVGALLFARGAQGRIRATLERAGGRTRVRWARRLAVAGICVALAASIAVGFYELLLRIEN